MVVLPAVLSGFIFVSFSAIGRFVVGEGLGKGRGEVGSWSGFILGVGLGKGRGEVGFWSGFILGVGLGTGRGEVGFCLAYYCG